MKRLLRFSSLLLAGILAIEAAHSQDRQENKTQLPSSITVQNGTNAKGKQSIAAIGKLPLNLPTPNAPKSVPSKWNSEGKLFLHLYRQSQQKGTDAQSLSLRERLKTEFGMRQISAGATKSTQDYIPVFLSYNEPSALQEAENLGFIPQTQLSRMCTGLIPVNAASRIEAIDGITRISASIQQEYTNDLSREASRVDHVQDSTRSRYGIDSIFDGKGVVLGIIDGGFDYTHPTFFGIPGDTSTYRVARVWNQTAEGTAPEEFGYGDELIGTQAILEVGYDLSRGQDDFHGTHVAGTAAGSGGGTGYKGMAPASELVFVPTSRGQSEIFDGIAYIRNYAKSVGKPCAINISLGSVIGSHDGKTDLNIAIDELVESDPEGFLIVASAGNNGAQKLHIEASLPDTTSFVNTFLSMSTPSNTRVDIWGGENEDFAVAIALADKEGNIMENSVVSASTQMEPVAYYLSPEGDTSTDIVYAYPSYNANNNKNNIQLIIQAPVCVAQGYYVLLQFQPYPPDTAHLHAWISGGEFANFGFDVMEGNTYYTHGSSSSASRNVLSVGAYNSRRGWRNIEGTSYQNPTENPLGDICTFSSRGPLVGGAIKPDIAAPGATIISAANSFNPVTTLYLIENTEIDGKEYPWALSQGTSMSSPAMAGIAALFLQQDPTMSINELKELLAETSAKDQYTGQEEKNATWGYGKVDATRALQSLTGTKLYPVYIEECEGGRIIVMNGPDSVRSGDLLAENSSLTLQIQTEEFYLFNQWWDGDTSETRTYVLTDSLSISASLEEQLTHVVTIQQNEGGHVQVTSSEGLVRTGSRLLDGSELVFSVRTDPGFVFDKWWDGNTEAPRSYTLHEDLDIQAFFKSEVASNESAQIQSARIYPNPSEGIFHLQCPGATEAKIYNLQGQLIKTIDSNLEICPLNMQKSKPGIYIIRVLYPQGCQTLKAIIQ